MEILHDPIELADGVIIEGVVDEDDPRIVGRRCVLVANEAEGWPEESGVVEGISLDGPWSSMIVRVDSGGPGNPDDPDGLREVDTRQVRLLSQGESQ